MADNPTNWGAVLVRPSESPESWGAIPASQEPAAPESQKEQPGFFHRFATGISEAFNIGMEESAGGQAAIGQAIEQTRDQPLVNIPVSPKLFPGASPEVAQGLAKGTSEVLSSLTAPSTAALGLGLGVLTAVSPPLGVAVASGLGAKMTGEAAGTQSALAEAGDVVGVAEQVPKILAGEVMTALPFKAATIKPEPPSYTIPEFRIPENRQLMAPRTALPEFARTTLEPVPPAKALPAPGETVGSVLLPESPLGPRTPGYRVNVPPFQERGPMFREPVGEPDPAAVSALQTLAKRSIEKENETGKPYQAPTVSTDLRQLQKRMRLNTVSTWENWADKTIKDKLGGASANPFFDPEFMSAAAVKGTILFKRGVRKFEDWSEPMIKQFGPGIHVHLKDLFEQAKQTAGEIGKDTPPQATEIGQALGKAIPSARTGDLPINLHSSDEFPSYQPWEVNERIAVQPQNFGRIPKVGWVMDPRALATEPVPKAMITHLFERQVGNAISLVEIEKLRGEINKPFSLSGTEFTNIKPTREGQSLHVSDVFEELQRDPNAYVLSSEQRVAFNLATRVLENIGDLLERAGLSRRPSGEMLDGDGQLLFDFAAKGSEPPPAYFPRPAVSKEGVLKPALPGVGGTLKRASEFFEKERAFDTERDGAQAGINYEPDIEGRLFTYAKSAYRAVAEKRLGEQLTKLGEIAGSEQRRARLANRWQRLLAEGKMSPEKFEHYVRNPYWEESKVDARVLRNVIFPDEVAAAIEKYRPRDIPVGLARADKVNNLFKTTTLGFDVGWLTLQGASLFKNPEIYARVAARSLEAVVNHETLKNILSNPDNLRAMRELAELGVPLGTLPDFQRGLAAGQILPKIPYVGPMAEAFGRGMQVFLDMGAMEMWKAWRDVAPKEQWPAVAEQIQNTFFRGRMEEIGTRPERAFFERLLFQAPAYYRGAINLIAGASRADVSGKVARRALGSILGASTFLFGAMATAVGLSWDEIKRRLNPEHGNFLMAPVEFWNGEKIEIGLGGPVRSIIRLFGQIVNTIDKNPMNLADPAKGDRNPIVRWLRSKMAPAPAIAWDIIKEKDFLGDDVSVWTLAEGRLPIAMQTEGFSEALVNFLGLQAWPESVRSILSIKREAMAKDKFGTSYGNLDMIQQFEIAASLQSDPELNAPRTLDEQRRIVGLAVDLDLQRKERLLAKLPKKLQDRFDETLTHVTGYDTAFTLQGVRLIFNQSQVKRYEELIAEQYKALLPDVFDDPSFDTLAPDRRQDVLNSVMLSAKQIARAQLIDEQSKKP